MDNSFQTFISKKINNGLCILHNVKTDLQLEKFCARHICLENVTRTLLVYN